MPEGQLTEEDLKNMSPEEIQELQKQQCIFCHIVSGKVASRKVYEDDSVIAILDINPANPGHVLLLPKEHYSIMPQVPEDVIGHMAMIAKHISQALLKALKVGGTYIFVANGVAAGQKAAHFMIHIIPRKEGDGLTLDIPEGTIKEQELEQLRDALASAIEKTVGSVLPEETEKIEPKEIEMEKPKPVVVEQETEESTDLDAVSALVAAKGVEETEEEPEETEEGRFVSSGKSEKFHSLNCPFAKNIKSENRVYFETEEDAKKAGKKPCGCVE